MLRRLIAVTALAAGLSIAAAVTLATPAFAKGPSQASITGPGLVRAVVVSGNGEPGEQGRLASLAEQTGLFTVMFGAGAGISGAAPARLHSPPPQAALGPRYTLVYTVPGVTPRPGQPFGRVRQDLYPGAAGGPLIYTPPGQQGFGGPLPVTGWLPGTPAAEPHAGPAWRPAATGRTGSAADRPPRGSTPGSSTPGGSTPGGASSGRTDPRLDHRAGRGHRGRGTHRHRVLAAPTPAGRRA
jgi:hypothetical protein